jgi:hypothetical protein
MDAPQKIVCKIPLTPNVAMPFGIVCTLSPCVKDSRGTLCKRLTICIPLWDNADTELYKAELTELGDSILLHMPATAAYLRNLDNVSEISNHMGFDAQTEEHHTAFCNKLERFKIDTVTVLLLFAKGETYNNKSFNDIDGDNDFMLEPKMSVTWVDTASKEVPKADKFTIAFNAALDENEGLDANKHVKQGGVDRVSDLYSKMLLRSARSNASSSAAGSNASSSAAGSNASSSAAGSNAQGMSIP